MQDFKRHFVTFFQGIAVGAAEIIPGVSGSTIALLLGIYDDFIELLYQGTEVVKTAALMLIGKKSFADLKAALFAIRWHFAVMLGVGMLFAIISLSSVITILLLELPHYLFAFLFGLIPPTLFIVYKQIRQHSVKTKAITMVTATAFLSIFVYSSSALSVANPSPIHLFIGGMVAISAMVLPGISGSFMLLVLGLYNFVVGLIAQLAQGTFDLQDLTQLGILMAGIGTGFLTTVRLLKSAFEQYRNELMSFLLGLLIASWYVLWPFVRVIGEDHGAPILEKVMPWQLGFTAVILALIAVMTTGIVMFLHQYADLTDTASPADDEGFDRL